MTISKNHEKYNWTKVKQFQPVSSPCIIKRIEVQTRLAVFTNRQCERDNGCLSVNSLAVIQIIRQAGFLLSKE